MHLHISLRKVGLICLSTVVLELVYTIIKYCVIKRYLRSKISLKKFGKWAVVTTSVSDCLGKEYAYALAKEGLCVVLIGKDVNKLDSFIEKIESEFGVRTMRLEVDLAELGARPDALLRNVEIMLLSLEVGVLVNCLSVTSPRPEHLGELPDCDHVYAAIVSCNVAAATLLVRVAVQGMAERRRGLVLLVSSTAALLPCPLLAVYAASQAYVHKFAHDLAVECAPLGIMVYSHTPGFIAESPVGVGGGDGEAGSGGGGRTLCRPTWCAPSARRYVQASLASLGTATCTPAYTPHCLLVWLARLFLWVAPGATTRAILRGMQSLRARALQGDASS